MQFWNAQRSIIAVAIFCVLILILCFGLLIYGTFEDVLIDREISKTYDTEIKPQAQNKISGIVDIANKQDSAVEKLTKISEWTSRFTYPNETFQVQDRYSQFSIFSLPPDRHYLKNDEDRWIIRRGKYAEDPMIIAYYECGRCGEMATIWNHTANRSGLITRQVSDPSGYHAWVEIQQGDDWYYVDPTIYPSDDLVLWFNSTKNRNQSQLIQKAARVMTSENQDITHYYPPYGTVKINNIGQFDAFFVRWDDGTGKSFIEPYDIRSKSSLEINLSVKNYTIYPFGLFPTMEEISVREGKVIEVDLDKKFKPVRLDMDKMEFPDIGKLPRLFKSE